MQVLDNNNNQMLWRFWRGSHSEAAERLGENFGMAQALRRGGAARRDCSREASGEGDSWIRENKTQKRDGKEKEN